MGYGREIMEENAWAMEDYWFRLEHGIWTMADGKEISVKNMSEDHIDNCINMIKRKSYLNDLDRAWLEVFEEEFNRRERRIKNGYTL